MNCTMIDSVIIFRLQKLKKNIIILICFEIFEILCIMGLERDEDNESTEKLELDDTSKNFQQPKVN